MIAYKIIGSVLLLAAGGVTSFAVYRYERRKLTVIDGFISLIMYIKGQIDCCLMPLPEILSGADRELMSACMSGYGERRFENMVRNCRFLLEREPSRLLKAFSSELGCLYRDEQLKRCEYYIAALTAEREKLSARFPARIKLASTLLLCFSAGAVILLW